MLMDELSPIEVILVSLKMRPTYCRNVLGQSHTCECKHFIKFYPLLSAVLFLRNALFYINIVVLLRLDMWFVGPWMVKALLAFKMEHL